jgi:hypothetical protein
MEHLLDPFIAQMLSIMMKTQIDQLTKMTLIKLDLIANIKVASDLVGHTTGSHYSIASMQPARHYTY